MAEYDDVMETGEWLEDKRRKNNQFSRYLTAAGDSVWLCHECCTVLEGEEPEEHDCEH